MASFTEFKDLEQYLLKVSLETLSELLEVEAFRSSILMCALHSSEVTSRIHGMLNVELEAMPAEDRERISSLAERARLHFFQRQGQA